MEDNNTQFIEFDKWCDKCKRKDIPETFNPPKDKEKRKEYNKEFEKCNECLDTPARDDGSCKPINFEEAD